MFDVKTKARIHFVIVVWSVVQSSFAAIGRKLYQTVSNFFAYMNIVKQQRSSSTYDTNNNFDWKHFNLSSVSILLLSCMYIACVAGCLFSCDTNTHDTHNQNTNWLVCALTICLDDSVPTNNNNNHNHNK